MVSGAGDAVAAHYSLTAMSVSNRPDTALQLPLSGSVSAFSRRQIRPENVAAARPVSPSISNVSSVACPGDPLLSLVQ